MDLVVTDRAVEFVDGGLRPGLYMYTDPFKPYLHPLRTPEGHTVSLAMPHDHPHHKGLMYALRMPGVNFWEERSTLPGEIVGRQVHERFEHLVESGEQVGFGEVLRWETETGETLLRERREVAVRRGEDGKSYRWTWTAELEPLSDVRLIKSQWSIPAATGNPINYHGLGIRLSREFGCTGNNAIVLDGDVASFDSALGLQPQRATFQGAIDGYPVAPRTSVTFQQTGHYGLFVLDKPFAFMSLGPSNLAELALQPNEILREAFVIEISDLS